MAISLIGLLSASLVYAQSSVSLEILIKQLQEQVKLLQTQVTELKSQLEVAKKEVTATQEELKTTKDEVKEIKEELKLTRALKRGESGEDVKKLQEFLKQFPDVYPEGLVTGFFGSLTEQAVKRFQEKHNIISFGDSLTTGYGQIGPRTLQKLNEFALPLAAVPLEVSEKKIVICHVPPGNPENKQTIEIGESALESHLTHGDSIKECPAVSPTPTPTPSPTPSPTPAPLTTPTPAPPPTTQAPSCALQSSSYKGPRVRIVSQSFAEVWWHTDELATKRFEWGLTSSYGKMTFSDYGRYHLGYIALTPGATHYYRITVKNAKGEIIVPSGEYTFRMTDPPPPNDARLQWVHQIIPDPANPKIRPSVSIEYHGVYFPKVKSFNVYLKKPGENVFTKINYPVGSSVISETGLSKPLQPFAVHSIVDLPFGEYQVYATAMDDSGRESDPTVTFSTNLYKPPTIISPAQGSTAPLPLQIDVRDNNAITRPKFSMNLYAANGSKYLWHGGTDPNPYVAIPSYSGPDLVKSGDPHVLTAELFGEYPTRVVPATCYNGASPIVASVFNVASSTVVSVPAPTPTPAPAPAPVPAQSSVDTTSSTISNVSASNVSASNATISWTTSMLSDSSVEFGPTISYGSTGWVGSLVTQHTVTIPLSPGATYHYRVKSNDAVGNLVTSGDFTLTTPAISADTTPPSVPTNLIATAVTSWSVTLQWAASTDNVGVAGYKLYRGVPAYPTPSLLEPSLTETSHTTIFVSPSSTYTYTVAAYDAAGNVSTQSNPITVITPASGSTADTSPPTISNVGGTNFTTTSVSIVWTTSEPADSQVEYGLTTAYGNVTTLDSNLVTSHSVALSGLQANTTYYYRIKTKDAAGNLATKTDWITTDPEPATATTSAISSKRDLASILKSLSSVLQKLQEALR